MSLKSWIVSKFAAAISAQLAEVGGWNVLQHQSGHTYHPETDQRSLVKKYQSWVYACSNKNAINCAQVPLRLYGARPSRTTKTLFPVRKLESEERSYLLKSPTISQYVRKAADVEEVIEHPFLNLLTQVNPFMNRFDLLEIMFLHQELTGNAYWKLVKGTLGLPEAIWPLMPQFIKIIPSKETFIDYYEHAISASEKHRIEVDEIIHFKYVNPRDAYYGLSPLQACVVAADLGLSMNEYETNIIQNRAIPEFIVKIPPEAGTMSPEEKERLTIEWKKKYSGVRKAGGFALMSGGADVKQLSLSPKEMNYLQGRKASLNEVAAVFGVPMSKLKTEDVNRANAEAGDYSYMKDTVLPRLRKVEQKLNEQLIPLYGDHLFVAFDNPVPDDKEYRLKELQIHLSTGYSSINEERQKDGQAEVDWGEVPIMAMNMLPIGASEVNIESEAVAANDGGKTVKRIKAPRRLPPLEHPTNFIDEKFEAEMSKYFRDLARDVLAEFDKDADKLKRYTPTTKAVADDFLAGWFDVTKWNGELPKRAEPFVRRTMISGGEKTLKRIAAQEFDPLNSRVLTALSKHRNTRLRSVNSRAKKRLRRTLAAGLEEGEGAAALRKRLQSEFKNMEASTATMIARTESIWAFNEGAVQAYLQSGLVSKKVWVSSDDDRSCDFCPTLDGQTVEVDSDFFGMGDTLSVTAQNGAEKELSFEYEEIGHPPLHPMCRCAIAPVIE